MVTYCCLWSPKGLLPKYCVMFARWNSKAYKTDRLATAGTLCFSCRSLLVLFMPRLYFDMDRSFNGLISFTSILFLKNPNTSKNWRDTDTSHKGKYIPTGLKEMYPNQHRLYRWVNSMVLYSACQGNQTHIVIQDRGCCKLAHINHRLHSLIVGLLDEEEGYYYSEGFFLNMLNKGRERI